MRISISPRSWVFVARFAFQACLIDRSSISPFRINKLRTRVGHEIADCDKSSNVPITYGPIQVYRRGAFGGGVHAELTSFTD
jgi:hypothetical protein